MDNFPVLFAGLGCAMEPPQNREPPITENRDGKAKLNKRQQVH